MNIGKFFDIKPEFKNQFNRCPKDVQKLLTRFFKTLGPGTEKNRRGNNYWYKTKYGFLSVRNGISHSIAFMKGMKETAYCHLRLRKNDLYVRLRSDRLSKNIPKSWGFAPAVYKENSKENHKKWRYKEIKSFEELEESIKFGFDNFDR